MIRFILFFLKLFLVLGGALFIAYTPGEVVFEWHGYRVHTTLGVFLGGMFLLSGFFAFLYLSGQYFWRLPRRILRAYEFKKFKKGYAILLAMQEERENIKDASFLVQAHKLQSLLPSRVLGLSLEAQAYEKQGDQEKARRLYTKLSSYKTGEYLSFSNLARLDFKQKDFILAKQEALEALQYKEQDPFSLFLLSCIALESEDFQEAASYVEKIKPTTSSQKQQKSQLKAYIWYKKSQQPEISLEEKVELLSYAYDFSPGFVPAALSYAKILIQDGKISKASKVLESNWKETQDRSIGALYISLGTAAGPLETFHKAKHLKDLTPYSITGTLLVAETALQAKLWGEARAALETIPSHKRSAYYYSLQSQIMEKEGEKPDQVLSALQENLNKAFCSRWTCRCCSCKEPVWAPFCLECYEINSLECSVDKS